MFTSGFFNSVNSDRKYNAEQMSAIFDGLITDGIFDSIGNHFAVTPGSGLQVKVGTGRAWLNQTWSYNDSQYPLSLSAASSSYARIDLICLKVDKSNSVRANSLIVVKGTPASSPVEPTVTDDTTNGIYYHKLAAVTVPKSATSISAANIRNYVGLSTGTPYVTGLLSSTTVDELWSQWDGEFNDWWDDIKATLDDNIVTTILNKIDHITPKEATMNLYGFSHINPPPSGKTYAPYSTDAILNQISSLLNNVEPLALSDDSVIFEEITTVDNSQWKYICHNSTYAFFVKPTATISIYNGGKAIQSGELISINLSTWGIQRCAFTCPAIGMIISCGAIANGNIVLAGYCPNSNSSSAKYYSAHIVFSVSNSGSIGYIGAYYNSSKASSGISDVKDIGYIADLGLWYALYWEYTYDSSYYEYVTVPCIMVSPNISTQITSWEKRGKITDRKRSRLAYKYKRFSNGIGIIYSPYSGTYGSDETGSGPMAFMKVSADLKTLSLVSDGSSSQGYVAISEVFEAENGIHIFGSIGFTSNDEYTSYKTDSIYTRLHYKTDLNLAGLERLSGQSFRTLSEPYKIKKYSPECVFKHGNTYYGISDVSKLEFSSEIDSLGSVENGEIYSLSSFDRLFDGSHTDGGYYSTKGSELAFNVGNSIFIVRTYYSSAYIISFSSASSTASPYTLHTEIYRFDVTSSHRELNNYSDVKNPKVIKFI